MISSSMEKALNGQINAELFSSYLYLSMEAYFKSVGLSGFAGWMRVQVQEELFHAMKFYEYLAERNGRVALAAIAQPETTWETPLKAFEHIQAHEHKVTGLIEDLVELAIKKKDHATHIFLQWFVSEQVEEESSVGAIVDRLRLVGKDTAGLFFLDAELAKRVFTPPAA
ncbi:MAG: ferritin [Desulfobulbaceae bacterium A2]|nr:MAG: ferritin [Desulfobulbaceae bacterium A2]